MTAKKKLRQHPKTPTRSALARPTGSAICGICKGKGWYAYDENHSKPCECCCKHDQGWWELTPGYGHYEAGKDNACCKAGCGTMRRDLPNEKLTDRPAKDQ